MENRTNENASSRFPLLHAPCWLWPIMFPVPVVCIPAKSVAGRRRKLTACAGAVAIVISPTPQNGIEFLEKLRQRSERISDLCHLLHHLKVRGRWVYLYRAVDREGHTVDFRLSPYRDTAAAKAFFHKAIRKQDRAPVSITLDGYAASHRAVREMQEDGLLPRSTELRCSKYLNNLIEQDHRGIKSRTRPMLGFKNYASAVTTIAGVELVHRIRKGQFSLGRLHLKDQAAPEIWNAVLAA